MFLLNLKELWSTLTLTEPPLLFLPNICLPPTHTPNLPPLFSLRFWDGTQSLMKQITVSYSVVAPQSRQIKLCKAVQPMGTNQPYLLLPAGQHFSAHRLENFQPGSHRHFCICTINMRLDLEESMSQTSLCLAPCPPRSHQSESVHQQLPTGFPFPSPQFFPITTGAEVVCLRVSIEVAVRLFALGLGWGEAPRDLQPIHLAQGAPCSRCYRNQPHGREWVTM